MRLSTLRRKLHALTLPVLTTAALSTSAAQQNIAPTNSPPLNTTNSTSRTTPESRTPNNSATNPVASSLSTTLSTNSAKSITTSNVGTVRPTTTNLDIIYRTNGTTTMPSATITNLPSSMVIADPDSPREVAKRHIEGIAINFESEVLAFAALACLGLLIRGVPYRVSFGSLIVERESNLSSARITITERDNGTINSTAMRWERLMNHAMQLYSWIYCTPGEVAVFPHFFQIALEKRISQDAPLPKTLGPKLAHEPFFGITTLEARSLSPLGKSRFETIFIPAKAIDQIAGTKFHQLILRGAPLEEIKASFNYGEAVRTATDKLAAASYTHSIQRYGRLTEDQSTQDVLETAKRNVLAVLHEMARPQSLMQKEHWLTSKPKKLIVKLLSAIQGKHMHGKNPRDELRPVKSVWIFTAEIPDSPPPLPSF